MYAFPRVTRTKPFHSIKVIHAKNHFRHAESKNKFSMQVKHIFNFLGCILLQYVQMRVSWSPGIADRAAAAHGLCCS